MDSERRRAPRYPIIADAEITEIVSNTKLSARTSDLSAGGCFLDMLNPSPEGTEIRVRISHANTTFATLGRVVFLFPNMGMGVMFTSVDASQQAVLQKWLEELGRSEG
jgi:c-di-GMP-binding flagellar brake protein YcgR